MRGDKRRKEEGIYKEYQSALRRFNNQLKSLSRELNLKSPVSSYTIRHSWATNAKYQGIPIEMISESLGHKSIKTTQTYLKGFGLKKKNRSQSIELFLRRILQHKSSITHKQLSISNLPYPLLLR